MREGVDVRDDVVAGWPWMCSSSGAVPPVVYFQDNNANSLDKGFGNGSDGRDDLALYLAFTHNAGTFPHCRN